ncbi:hypothetical protein [Spirosoma endbachense]|uniref:DUF2178 domain-containing protein n=1 Tax=Spirosoma endbachense TaxID=2666025 RepID=A0A6P1VQK1_9BACT|nr:hypothetical protein [Spirosoma endbachense]QHV95373.1 hypothetical protein GJR95_10285 [Spirosoma endbachense]
MKQLIRVLTALATPLTVQAQTTTPYIDRDLFAVCVTIVGGGFVLLFILEVIKRLFDFLLKRKALELGLQQAPTTSQPNYTSPIKWFAIWIGLGIGLTIIYYTFPLGIHSLAIMSFCLAASFLSYFIFLKQSANK